MSMVNVGIYLQAIRDGRGMSRAKVADLVGSTENTIWRIETGRQDPSGSLLLAVIQAVNASINDVQRLFNEGTEQDAREAARDWIAQQSSDVQHELDRRARGLIQQIQNDPRVIDRILEQMDRLQRG